MPRIEHMPGHVADDKNRQNLHSSAWTKRSLALRRLDRRRKNRAARQARKATA